MSDLIRILGNTYGYGWRCCTRWAGGDGDRTGSLSSAEAANRVTTGDHHPKDRPHLSPILRELVRDHYPRPHDFELQPYSTGIADDYFTNVWAKSAPPVSFDDWCKDTVSGETFGEYLDRRMP